MVDMKVDTKLQKLSAPTTSQLTITTVAELVASNCSQMHRVVVFHNEPRKHASILMYSLTDIPGQQCIVSTAATILPLTFGEN